MADDKIFVKAHPDMGDRVALWERHPDHEGGEVFIAGQDQPPVEVPMTPGVMEALAPQGARGELPGKLIRLEGPALEAAREHARLAEERKVRARAAALAAQAVAANQDPRVAAMDERLNQMRELEGKLAEMERRLGEAAGRERDEVRRLEATREERGESNVPPAEDGEPNREPAQMEKAVDAGSRPEGQRPDERRSIRRDR